jgi:hypothetical protein
MLHGFPFIHPSIVPCPVLGFKVVIANFLPQVELMLQAVNIRTYSNKIEAVNSQILAPCKEKLYSHSTYFQNYESQANIHKWRGQPTR